MAENELEVIAWETHAAGVITCPGPYAGRLVRLKDHYAEILMDIGFCRVVHDHADGTTATELLERMLQHSAAAMPRPTVPPSRLSAEHNHI